MQKLLILTIGLEQHFHEELLKKLQKCFDISDYYDEAMNEIVENEWDRRPKQYQV